MKKTVICISGNPEFIKRFSRWLKNRYNVEFPSKEIRFQKLNLVITWWEIAYHNDWVIGNSESKLEAIAQAALSEHYRHAHPNNAFSADWSIYSE